MKKILCYFFPAFTAVLFVASCTKIRTTELGSDLIPAVDNVHVFDTTLDIISEIYELPDTTRVRYGADHPIGLLNDPSFGNTNAEAYLQLLPAGDGYYPFGTSRDSIIGLDSLVLSLRYKSVYGDSNAVQTFTVSEIDQSAPFRDSVGGYLISHPSFATGPELARKENILFSTLNDSITYIRIKDTVKTANELRITLPLSLGQRLMNYDTTIYKTDSAFNANFKGFALKADAAASIKRALAYFNFSDAGTHLSFYYRKIKSGVADTTVTDFVLGHYSGPNDELKFATAALIKRDPTGSAYANNLLSGANNQEELFIQSSPGSYALIKIPGLDKLNNRLIYKAVLTTSRLDGMEDNYFIQPNLLFLDAVDSVNHKFLTLPNSFLPNSSLPLVYNPEIFGGYIKNGKYEFDLSRYVQGIVTKKEKSYSLRLYAPYYTTPEVSGATGNFPGVLLNPPVSKGRVIVSGGAHPSKKMRLYIIYSKI